MRERIGIATPDNVTLQFEVAGPGSRFLALAIDTTLWFLLVLLLLLLPAVGWQQLGPRGLAGAESWVSAVVVLALFLTRWGYHIGFEVLLGGRTPGKMALGIRVLREDGLPPEPRQILIRNLLRVVDMLPPPLYLVGGVSLLASRRGQRLGDMAAGTLVTRERFQRREGRKPREQPESDYGASWMAKIQQGQSQYVLVLPKGKVSIRQLALIEAYFGRRHALPVAQRERLAWQIVRPLLPLFDRRSEDWDPQQVPEGVRLFLSEQLMQEVREQAAGSPAAARGPAAPAAGPCGPRRIAEDAARKAHTWSSFSSRVDRLLRRGAPALRKLSGSEMKSLLVDYRRITTDLARAQSLQADPATLARLNRLAIRGHNLMYRYQRPRRGGGLRQWPGLFAREFRSAWRAVALAAGLFFAAALVSAVAVLRHPPVAFDLVGPEFYDFSPASGEVLHEIPHLMRPVAASLILTNNLQVSILAFAGGMTAGLGTALLLVYNGMHLGSVVGWMTLRGSGRALWGWVMPHGATEIAAVIVAAAAGFLLARGMLLPGQLRRGECLRRMGRRALVLELGCMAMLLVAGLIEGFVSPSGIGFGQRILILVGSVLLWGLYFAAAGRASGAGEKPEL